MKNVFFFINIYVTFKMASSSKEKIKQFNFKICNNHGETPRERSCNREK